LFAGRYQEQLSDEGHVECTCDVDLGQLVGIVGA